MIRAVLATAMIGALSGCATHRRMTTVTDFGIDACPANAALQLLSTDALQCWFDAPHGRWRTLSHESHYAMLVAQVEAADVRDADYIARRFVAGERESFSEILVYVQRELASNAAAVRRIRWTPSGGFESLDFTGLR